MFPTYVKSALGYLQLRSAHWGEGGLGQVGGRLHGVVTMVQPQMRTRESQKLQKWSSYVYSPFSKL